ncbi:MAG: hypothetical protein IJC25_07930 [Clostridia bacterium]|nr:hypothetical protein [Clostridia bacterium]
MTSKERILNTIYRRPTDRVPISMCELCPLPDNTYAPFANKEPSYARLMQVIAEKTDTIMLRSPSVSYPDHAARTETLTERVGKSTLTQSVLHTPKGDLVTRKRVDDDVYTVWTLEHPLKDPEDAEKYRSLDFFCRVDMTPVYRNQQLLGEDGIVCMSVSDPLARACKLFAMEDFLVWAVSDTEDALAFLDFLWQQTQEELRQMLCGDVRDMMIRITGPEYATPPYLKEEYFEDFVLRYLAPMTKMIREAGAIPRVHSHGKVRHALGRIATTDAMVAEPIEPLPDGDIPLCEAKRLYGDKLTLMGNIELKELEYASAERVEQLVRTAMDEAKEGGGFILMPTATPINIPLAPKTEQNLITMIEAAHRWGRY